jgi:phosphoribosyl 1,2-cyclic phosphodiesterase
LSILPIISAINYFRYTSKIIINYFDFISEEMKVLFMGTGTSGCVPSIACLLQPEKIPCRICPDAYSNPKSYNHRLNTSILIQVPSPTGVPGMSGVSGEAKPGKSVMPGEFQGKNQKGRFKEEVNILVDCGKTYLWSSLAFFPKLGVTHLNALLLTHPHADAMLGLDDLRGWTMNGAVQSSIDVYCDRATLRYISQVFPYLIDKKLASGGGDVPSLVFHELETCSSSSSFDSSDSADCQGVEADDDGFTCFNSFNLHGVQITPFHVQHGYKGAGKPFYSVGINCI